MSSKRQAWLEALRSGDYQQGRGALKQKDEGNGVVYCCLGVACEVIAPERFSDRPRYYRKYTFTGKVCNSEHEFEFEGTPPADVLKLMGISEQDAVELIHLNDSETRDFHFIADYIEALPQL